MERVIPIEEDMRAVVEASGDEGGGSLQTDQIPARFRPAVLRLQQLHAVDRYQVDRENPCATLLAWG